MKIDHIALWVTNLEGMKQFYTHYFGAVSNEKYTNTTRHFESYFLSFETGARLELMKMPSIPPTLNDCYTQFSGLIHFAVSVGSELQVNSLTEKFRKDGYQIMDGPRWTGDGYYESVVLDPEKNRIEITI